MKKTLIQFAAIAGVLFFIHSVKAGERPECWPNPPSICTDEYLDSHWLEYPQYAPRYYQCGTEFKFLSQELVKQAEANQGLNNCRIATEQEKIEWFAGLAN